MSLKLALNVGPASRPANGTIKGSNDGIPSSGIPFLRWGWMTSTARRMHFSNSGSFLLHKVMYEAEKSRLIFDYLCFVSWERYTECFETISFVSHQKIDFIENFVKFSQNFFIPQWFRQLYVFFKDQISSVSIFKQTLGYNYILKNLQMLQKFGKI